MVINYKDVLEFWSTQKPIRSGKTLHLAIGEAIEKQIERPPIVVESDIWGRPYVKKIYCCPRCRVSVNEVIDSPYIYCHKCGQAIDKSSI